MGLGLQGSKAQGASAGQHCIFLRLHTWMVTVGAEYRVVWTVNGLLIKIMGPPVRRAVSDLVPCLLRSHPVCRHACASSSGLLPLRAFPAFSE